MEINKLQFNPVFSRVIDDDVIDGDQFEKWYDETFLETALILRLGIGSETAEQEVEKICGKFGISDWQKIGYTARIIRDIFCDNLKEVDIKERALKELGIRNEDINVFLQTIKNAVKEIKQAGEREYHELIDKITLKEAVRKYPEVQEQLISEEKLEIESEEYLVAGTVKNWLNDYFQTAGGNKHNALERSEYLFRSKNARVLNKEEQEKLGVVLRSFDEDSLVAIDRENKEIDFKESLDLNEGKTKLNGIIDSYDKGSDSLNKFSIEKKSTTGSDFRTEDRFQQIKNTPHFEVDEKKEENAPERFNNIVSLKQKENNPSSREENKKKNYAEKNQNVLDLSDYN